MISFLFFYTDWNILLALLLMCCLSSISEHYATVTLTFTDKANETELKIECRGVPESEEERTRDGWQRYYCHAIKQTFGYGARLCWAHDVAGTVFDSTFLFYWFYFQWFWTTFTWDDLSATEQQISHCTIINMFLSDFDVYGN